MLARRPMMSGAVLALAAAVTLSACQVASPFGAGLDAQGAAASSAKDPDGPDLDLNSLPTESFQMPARPTRAAQSVTAGNAASLYVFPTETLPQVKALITGAKRSLYLETFNFGWESYGEQIVPLIVERARAGVECKIVMDYVGSRFLKGNKDMLKMLRAAGVEVKLYRPRLIMKGDRRLGINITHRKVYLADGQRALVGGVNLQKGFDTTTQDALILWRGPIVAQLYNEFARDWYTAKGSTLRETPDPTPATPGSVKAQIVVTSAPEGRLEAQEAAYDAIDGARNEILIEQQYLCEDALIRRLHDAARRGVSIRVMVPGPEHGFVFSNIHALELHKLQAEGAQARVYHGIVPDAHLHVKYMSVDNRWAMLGSTNFDSRGFIENQELSTITADPELVAGLRNRLFEADWKSHSDPFVYKEGGFVIKGIRSLLELIDYYL